MPSKSRVPDRKRQRTVDDSSEEEEASDLVNATIEEEEDDDDENENENENEASINDDMQELEEEDDDDDDDDDDVPEEEEEEDESADENEAEEEEPEVEDEEDGVDAEDEEQSLDDDSELPEDDFNADIDPMGPSRRMTARQRNRQLGTTANIGVVDLDDISGSNRTKKKALSAEEQRIKRAEMARRRRNLSQKRLEEEKQDTLDKLLKKRAGKVRGETDEQGEPINRTLRSKLHPPHPALMSWRSSQKGFTLSMTEERAQQENLA